MPDHFLRISLDSGNGHHFTDVSTVNLQQGCSGFLQVCRAGRGNCLCDTVSFQNTVRVFPEIDKCGALLSVLSILGAARGYEQNLGEISAV